MASGSVGITYGLEAFTETVTDTDTKQRSLKPMTAIYTGFAQMCIMFMGMRRAIFDSFIGFAMLFSGILSLSRCKEVFTVFDYDNANVSFVDVNRTLQLYTNVTVDGTFASHELPECLLHHTHLHDPIKYTLITFVILMVAVMVTEIVYHFWDPSNIHQHAVKKSIFYHSRWNRLLECLSDMASQVTVSGVVAATAFYLLSTAESDRAPSSAEAALFGFSILAFIFLAVFGSNFVYCMFAATSWGRAAEASVKQLGKIEAYMGHIASGRLVPEGELTSRKLIHWAQLTAFFGTIAMMALTMSTVTNAYYPLDSHAHILGWNTQQLTVTEDGGSPLDVTLDIRATDDTPVEIWYNGNSTLRHTLQHHRSGYASAALTLSIISLLITLFGLVAAVARAYSDAGRRAFDRALRSRPQLYTTFNNNYMRALFVLSWGMSSLGLNIYMITSIAIVMYGYVPQGAFFGIFTVFVGSCVLLAAAANSVISVVCMGGSVSHPNPDDPDAAKTANLIKTVDSRAQAFPDGSGKGIRKRNQLK